MQRRQFLTGSTLATIGLPFLSSLIGSSALAGESFTDNDSDYAKENGWETLVDKPNLLLKRKMLLTMPNGFIFDFEGKPVLDVNGNQMPDALKCQLIRFSKNFLVGKHAHADSEFTYVLAGSFIQTSLTAGPTEYQVSSSIFMPARTIHEAATAGDKGVTILSFAPRNVIGIK